MSTILKRVQRMLFVVVAGIFGFSMLAPLVALGNGDLVSGDTAVVSTGGGNATLRSDASTDAESIGSLPDGTEIYIIEGPITGADGSLWYYAGVWDLTGYISASLLAGSGGTDADTASTTESSEEEPTTTVIPWKDPIDYGVVVDNSNEPLPVDGLACRVDALTDAEVITRIPLGATLEVTGAEVWNQGLAFLPVNCDGQGGFVRADYVVLDSETAEPEPAADEPAADVVVTEEPVVADDQSSGDVPTSDDVPVVGDLIVTVLDQNGQAVPGACFELFTAAGWVAGACDSNDAIPNNGNSGFFGVAEGGYTLVASSAPEGVTIDNQEVSVVAGETSYATVTVPVQEPVVTEEPAEEVVPTDEPVVTEEPADDAVTEEPSENVVATEVPTDETAPTEEPVVTEEPAEDAVTEEPTDVAATEEPIDEVAPTEEPIATEEPTETATTEEATPAEESGVDVSGALGDATVTGTNGVGVRCRVAPDPNAATIAVLAEGTTVFVLENPVNGFLGVACGDQLGYVDLSYMWAGGAGDEIPSSASSVVVVGTGGSRLNCRSGPGTGSSVLTSVAQGTVLTSRGASNNGWAPVVCNGQNGFVSINFIEVSGGSSTDTGGDSGADTSAGTGVISNLGGDRLRCRSTPGGPVIITLLAEGTTVTVRGAASNGWVPIVCAGSNGYVSSDYITLGTSGGPAPGEGDGNGGENISSGSVKVTGTGGASLNCRTAPSLSGMVITSIPAGSTLAVRGAASNGWVPVTCGGKSGYVSATYVTATSEPGGGSTDPDPDPGGGSSPTGTATVANTNGDGLRCRVSPGGTIITTIAEGQTVGTRGPSSNGWTPVVCGGRDGYMSSQYLSTGGGTTNPDPDPEPQPSGFKSGDHVKLTANVNLRYSASTSANVATVVPAGTVVLIKGGPSNNYYQVDWDGLGGYLYADYLTKTSEGLSERGGSGNEPNPAPNPGGGSATGNAMVNFAMRYVGYPYVWATHGPSSFDCSGFTYWVTKNVTGANIGTGLWTQWAAGTPVSRSALQPGDLVFFQNTYKAGLSHVGIYIGNNQFVHAENENTGVRVSDLNSNYYGSRWLGARRMT